MIIEGETISNMAKKLKVSRHTIEMRLSRAGIKPIISEFLYPINTIEKIKDAKKGRPKKDS